MTLKLQCGLYEQVPNNLTSREYKDSTTLEKSILKHLNPDFTYTFCACFKHSI